MFSNKFGFSIYFGLQMDKSQRINLIIKIAEEMSNLDWDIIDGKLRQFNLRWQEEWNGNYKKSYIIDSLEDAEAGQLIRLASSLDIRDFDLYPLELPNYWSRVRFRVFISYRSRYKKEAGELAYALRPYLFTTFVAHRDIPPLTVWRDELLIALKTAQVYIALLTEDFREGEWTDNEVGFGLGRNRLVIPISYGGEPYGLLEHWHHGLAFTEDYDYMASQISELIMKNELTGIEYLWTVIHHFANSSSWNDAKKYISMLEDFPTIPSVFLDLIHDAAQTNREIADAFGVPSRVETLVKRHQSPNPPSLIHPDDIPF